MVSAPFLCYGSFQTQEPWEGEGSAACQGSAALDTQGLHLTFPHPINIFQMGVCGGGQAVKEREDKGASPSSPRCLCMGQESLSHTDLCNAGDIWGQLFKRRLTVTP